MTHAEATARNAAGLPPSPCPGELEPVESHPDRVFDGGTLRDVEVRVYRCERCDFRVVLEGTRLRNAYAIPARPGREEGSPGGKPGPGATL